MKLKISTLQKKLKKYIQSLRIKDTAEFEMIWNVIMI